MVRFNFPFQQVWVRTSLRLTTFLILARLCKSLPLLLSSVSSFKLLITWDKCFHILVSAVLNESVYKWRMWAVFTPTRGNASHVYDTVFKKSSSYRPSRGIPEVSGKCVCVCVFRDSSDWEQGGVYTHRAIQWDKEEQSIWSSLDILILCPGCETSCQ